jgi:hypothetical protein
MSMLLSTGLNRELAASFQKVLIQLLEAHFNFRADEEMPNRSGLIYLTTE